jgi:hypothetical protein
MEEKPWKACRDILRRENHTRIGLDDQQRGILIDPAGQLPIFIEIDAMKRLRQRGRKTCRSRSPRCSGRKSCEE